MRVSEIREHLAKWEAAADAVAKGKSYTIDGLTYTRQDADRVREQLEYWTRRLAACLRGRGSIRRQTARIDDIGGCKLC